jgi:hypothetical protein
MSNLKISQLPNFTGNTSGSWLIANNSGQTETFKIQRESFLSGYQPSGNYATTGSNTFIGNQTITGSINVSGSVVLGPTITGLEGINFMSGSVIGALITYNPTNGGRTGILSMGTNGLFGRVNIGSSGDSGSLLLLNKTSGGITTLIGSSSISLQGNNIDVTGSLTASGSLHRLIGAVTVSGSVTTTGNVNVSGSIVLNGVSENIYFNSGSGIGAFVSYDPTLNGVGGTLSVNTNGTVGLVNLGASGVNGASLSLNKQIGKATLFGSSSISLQGNNIDVTGSVNISQVMTLAKQNPLPTGTTGSLAVSGSGLYFHNGTSWSLIS